MQFSLLIPIDCVQKYFLLIHLLGEIYICHTVHVNEATIIFVVTILINGMLTMFK